MDYKFDSNTVNDKELEIAKKAKAIYQNFKKELNANGLSVRGVTIGYTSDDKFKRYITLND